MSEANTCCDQYAAVDRVLELWCRLRKELTKVVEQPDGTTTLKLPADDELNDAVHAARMVSDQDYIAAFWRFNAFLVERYYDVSAGDLTKMAEDFGTCDPDLAEEIRAELARRSGTPKAPRPAGHCQQRSRPLNLWRLLRCRYRKSTEGNNHGRHELSARRYGMGAGRSGSRGRHAGAGGLGSIATHGLPWGPRRLAAIELNVRPAGR